MATIWRRSVASVSVGVLQHPKEGRPVSPALLGHAKHTESMSPTRSCAQGRIRCRARVSATDAATWPQRQHTAASAMSLSRPGAKHGARTWTGALACGLRERFVPCMLAGGQLAHPHLFQASLSSMADSHGWNSAGFHAHPCRLLGAHISPAPLAGLGIRQAGQRGVT